MLTQVEEVTRRRADRPTQRKAARSMSRETISLTIFGAGAGRFGIPTEAVLYIARTPALTPASVPSPWIRGVARLRGETVEVWDMAAWFKSPKVSSGVFTVVVGSGAWKVGLLVDRIVGFRETLGGEAPDTVDRSPVLSGSLTDDTPTDITAVIDTTRLLKRAVARGGEEALAADPNAYPMGDSQRDVSRGEGASYP
jgi:chemotaxis signal transduction protein